MFYRILALAHNGYREAVRARLLIGVLALSLAACVYSVVIAALSGHNELRVVSDLGAASISLLGVVVAILLGSTSLYRELELKTIFPILSRPVRRWEYVVGKYLGALLTVVTFFCVDLAAVLAVLAVEAERPAWLVVVALAVGLAALVAVLALAPRATAALVPWGLAMCVTGWLLAAPAGDERRLVVASALLSLAEVSVVAAVATFFASFSSPMLTAAFTTMLFLIGRSSDTLAHLPKRLFGQALVAGFHGIARVVPNLRLYVPARSLLLGQGSGPPLWAYVGGAVGYAVAYATGLLVVSSLIFRRRDFP